MARQKTVLERNTFVKGLITEANSLTFPENASAEEYNFVLSRDGSRQRRLGLDAEPGTSDHFTADTPESNYRGVIYTYLWENVGGSDAVSVLIVQTGSSFGYHVLRGGNLNDTTRKHLFTLPLDTADQQVSCCVIEGDLVVTHIGLPKPQLIKYDEATESLSVDSLLLEVRDIWGVEPPYKPNDYRPHYFHLFDFGDVNLEKVSRHYYNCLNQGFPARQLDDGYPSAFGSGDTSFPSRADVPWVCRKNDGGWNKGYLRYSTFGNALAPTGRIIMDYRNRGMSRIEFMDGQGLRSRRYDIGYFKAVLPEDRYNGTPTQCVTFAGRVFYGGFKVKSGDEWTDKDPLSPDYKSAILFSQVAEGDANLGRCYQANDPTAEDSVGVVASDGGYIKVSGMGQVERMVVSGDSLVIFASNGVWQLSGDAQYGTFRADAYSINKLTDEGAIGADAIINVGSAIMYWGEGGIYMLSPDPASGRLSAKNITERTIQSLYNRIAYTGKLSAKGVYDPSSRTARWLYRESVDDSTWINRYDRELIFDTVLGAWSVFRLPVSTNVARHVCSYVDVGEYFINEYDEEVTTITGEPITVYGTTSVTVPIKLPVDQTSSIKYMYVDDNTQAPDRYKLNYRFGYYWRDDFLDFAQVDAAAKMRTGSDFLAGTMTKKGGIKLHVHMERTETGFEEDKDGNLIALNPSSCLVSTYWDLADSPRSGKITTPIQAYRLRRPYFPQGTSDTFDYGWEVITSRSTVRGSGKSLALMFETEEGKDCKLLGWALEVPEKGNA